MTVAEWLTARTPEPPPRLGSRIEEVLQPRLSSDAHEVPIACIDAACDLLESLVVRPDAGREAALDLLTADALVTYAFEALAGDPPHVTEFALSSMQRLAVVAPQRR